MVPVVGILSLMEILSEICHMLSRTGESRLLEPYWVKVLAEVTVQSEKARTPFRCTFFYFFVFVLVLLKLLQ